jgi:sortase A
MRRPIRIAGTVMIVAGALVLAWVVVVWRWQDPFTALYTMWQQHQLADDYKHRVASFHPAQISADVTVAVEKREIALEARRYRLASKPGEAIGRIKVPRLGLNMILVDGTDHDSLTRGPGLDRRTHFPGEGQLVYIAGHRTTYLAPFSAIDTMRRGDSVTIELPYATFHYRVRNHVIVPADDLSRLRSHGREILALQACHPRFFATNRYIVYAVPVRIEPRSGPAYTLDQSTKLAAPSRPYASRR